MVMLLAFFKGNLEWESAVHTNKYPARAASETMQAQQSKPGSLRRERDREAFERLTRTGAVGDDPDPELSQNAQNRGLIGFGDTNRNETERQWRVG